MAVEVQDPYFGNDLIHLHTGCKLKVSETRYAFSKITVVSNIIVFFKYIYYMVLLFNILEVFHGGCLSGRVFDQISKYIDVIYLPFSCS